MTISLFCSSSIFSKKSFFTPVVLKLAQEKAEEDLVVLSENIYDRLSGGSSLEALSEESNLELLRVENISRDGALENGSINEIIGKKEKVQETLEGLLVQERRKSVRKDMVNQN